MISIIKYSIGLADITLDQKGCVTSITAAGAYKTELLPVESTTPFIQLGLNQKLKTPIKLENKNDLLCFTFENKSEINLCCKEKNSYAVFEITEVKGDADAVIFGPFFTILADSIGDIIGVAQSTEYTMGVQALNIKTIGGFPEEYKECVSEFVSSVPLSQISVASVSYFESAGYHAVINGDICGLLQLYCENRSRERRRDIMGHTNIAAAPMEASRDAKIVGSKFAMFVCQTKNTLETIGKIELGEGLPHPTFDGEWAKISRKSMQSYLIAEFDKDNITDLLKSAKRAGFTNLYHPEPFANWGHFVLRKDFFPNGDASLKDYCKLADGEGMKLGLHTLTSFTTTNDDYVSPVPHKNLAKLGRSVLSSAISKSDEDIAVEDIKIFNEVTTLQTVQIGDELIKYELSDGNLLKGCERGAFVTKASAHSEKDVVELLFDHPYRVFFPDIKLQSEYTKRLASLFDNTGVSQISFDGLEGCNATGESDYAINRFCDECWSGINRSDFINDASRLHHFLWHMNTRMNWGEPWGEKMREGMIESRISNQDFYRRNLFPRMLGWFLIRKADRKFEATPPEDIEWALSMAAGFDAGFALSTSQAVLETNGCSGELLDTINNWEELRMKNAFSKELQEKLIDPKTEWHLEKDESGGYTLYELCISKPFVCDLLELQPGQPGGADWAYENKFDRQEFDFRLRVEGNGEIINPAFITKNGMCKFNCRVKGGQYLWYRNKKAVITDRNYRPIQEIKAIGEGIVESGKQGFSFSCGFEGEEGPEVTVTVFTLNKGVILNTD